MELKDTIEQMTSTDYKERFKAEYWQLKIRCEKLETFIDEVEKGKKETTCPLSVLYNQLYSMDGYRLFLKRRAKIEHIDLSEAQNGAKSNNA